MGIKAKWVFDLGAISRFTLQSLLFKRLPLAMLQANPLNKKDFRCNRG
jgi:hypothetical protein